MDWFPTLALRETLVEITHRLEEAYHATSYVHGAVDRLPPVDELVLTILSQSTTDANSSRGYRALKARFPHWAAVADAPVEEIEATIRASGLARQKAPRIKAILQEIRAERGEITLDFLAELPPDEALAYLMRFHGVGRKTASCVLLFSLDQPAMPVDTHIVRIAARMALIPEGTTADQAHDMLEAALPEEDYLTFHVNMIAHGRRTCTALCPACERCPVLDLCPYGQQRLGGTASPERPSPSPFMDQ